MKNFFKKYDIYFLFAFIVLIVIINTFFHIFDAYDELWNFQNLYKMYNDYTIYKDSNIIITPIFFIVGNFLFHIFGATINTFRFYSILINVLQYILIFYIFKNLNTNKNLSFLYLTLIFSNIYSITSCGANYNLLAIDFILLGVILYLKQYNKKRYNIYQGIIIFLVFFTKQNLGVFYAIGIVLFELIDKKISKYFFLNQLQKFIFFMIPTSLSCITMYLDGNLFDFINYVFGGLFNFGNSNLYIDSSILEYISILLIIIGLYIFIIKNKNILSKECKKNITFLFILSICISLVIFPIINFSHLIFAYILLYILLFHILDTILINHIFYAEYHFKITNWCCVLFLFIILLHILSSVYTNFDLLGNFDRTHPFYNAPIKEETIEKINIVSEYIKEKNSSGTDVIIVASDSAYTMINLNQSHRAFDLVFNGNLGYHGVEHLINEIKNCENTEFLIYTDEEDRFWQESDEIREYIISNLEKIGNISNYSIYYK